MAKTNTLDKKSLTKNNGSNKTLNVKNFTKVHRKVGLFFMPLLLIIVITGAWSLFRAEVVYWQFPQYDVGQSVVPGLVEDQSAGDQSREKQVASEELRKSWHDLVTLAREEHNFQHNDFHIFDNRRFGDYIVFYNKTDGVEDMLFMDPVTGEAIDSSELSFSETLYDLHMRLLLPSSFGKYIIGLLGLLLTFLVFNGFLAHKNIRKNFYRLRLHKGRQIFATDLHKMLGSWSLVFSGLMSVTGALLGIFGVVLIILALAAYGGDQQALFADFLGVTPDAVGGTAEFMSLDTLYQMANQQWSGYTISTIEVHHYADPAMHVTFEGELMNGFLTQQHITYNAINGQVSFITDFTEKGAGGYLYSALPSLHFASFGGTWLKIIYWVLTLVLLLIMVTGMTIKSLRLREQPFSISDRVVIALSEAVILASSIGICMAFYLPELGNPANSGTLGLVMLVALAYNLIHSLLLSQFSKINSVNLAGWLLVITAGLAVFDGQVLLMSLCLSLALTWWCRQKIGSFVSKAQTTA